MSPVVRRIRCYLGEKRTSFLRQTGFLRSDWTEGLPEEVAFWARALANQGRDWNPSDYAERMDPQLPLQAELRELIDAPEGGTVRILDVGSGPLTRVGRVWPGRVVEITPVDPLAEEYRALIARLGISVPVLPQTAEGERLRDRFREDSFDLAYASNCLDHAFDPVVAIREMLAMLKPSCFAYLWHYPDAGLQERYRGLHQWNFNERGGDLTVSDGRRTVLLSEALQDWGAVDCFIETASGSPVVIARVRKLATPPRLANPQ
jgi:SAM-dependent methyltransferase